KQEVQAELDGVEDLAALEQAYHVLTGFRLQTVRRGESSASTADFVIDHDEAAQRLEINEAYAVLREALEPFGLLKAGLKQTGIALTFISPQVGDRQRDLIRQLAQRTGYPLSIHPHPNQQQILQLASQIAREGGWSVRKGPG